jgi:hypothetical protein
MAPRRTLTGPTAPSLVVETFVPGALLTLMSTPTLPSMVAQARRGASFAPSQS